MTVFSNTTVRCAAQLDANHPLAATLEDRSDIFAMTEQAQDAALRPRNSGGLSHSERAALASRMARLNGEDGLADHFASFLTNGNAAKIADPTFEGASNPRYAALIRHTDLVTRDTKSVTAADITELKDAGISEDDIVRLSELVAFVNYQARVCRGLRLLSDVS